MTQPPLSKQIQGLEDYLGVALLRRDRRGVELTVAGAAFRDAAIELMATAERARQSAQRAANGETGLLRIGFMPTGNHVVLFDALDQFRKTCPDVRVEIRNMSTTAQLDALQSRQLDLGFVRAPVRAENIAIRIVSSESLCVALPAAWDIARLESVHVADLHNRDLIFFPRAIAPLYYDLIMNFFSQSNYKVNVFQEIEHPQTLMTFVSRGYGFTVVPDFQHVVGYPGVVYRPLVDELPKVQMASVHRPQDDSPVLRRFLDALSDSLRA
jgi:DNA-binding transcriptional LysR family regulator